MQVNFPQRDWGRIQVYKVSASTRHGAAEPLVGRIVGMWNEPSAAAGSGGEKINLTEARAKFPASQSIPLYMFDSVFSRQTPRILLPSFCRLYSSSTRSSNWLPRGFVHFQLLLLISYVKIPFTFSLSFSPAPWNMPLYFSPFCTSSRHRCPLTVSFKRQAFLFFT